MIDLYGEAALFVIEWSIALGRFVLVLPQHGGNSPRERVPRCSVQYSVLRKLTPRTPQCAARSLSAALA